MPGRKSISSALVCLGLWTAAAQQPKPASPPAKRPARSRPALGPNAEFLGWRGETAFFREEIDHPKLPPRVTYNALGGGSTVTAIAQPRSSGPNAPQPGRTVLADYAPSGGDTAVRFQLDSNPDEVAELGSAIAKWTEEGSGKPRTFPVVHASLLLALTRNGKEEIVWKQHRDLTAMTGEAGYLYDPPRLRFAALSPTGATLLAELVSGAGSEFLRIPLPKTR